MWKSLSAVWTGSYSNHSIFGKLLGSILVILSWFSLANIRHLFAIQKVRMIMEIYVLAWSVVLTLSLALGSYTSVLIVIVAVYRIFDIIIYRFYFFFVKSVNNPWTAASLRRSVLLAFVNFYEVITGFAIIYRLLGTQICNSSGESVGTAIKAFYFSAVTMMTVGFGDFTPRTDLARIVVLVQLGTFVTFAVLLFPALISLLSPVLYATKAEANSEEE